MVATLFFSSTDGYLESDRQALLIGFPWQRGDLQSLIAAFEAHRSRPQLFHRFDDAVERRFDAVVIRGERRHCKCFT